MGFFFDKTTDNRHMLTSTKKRVSKCRGGGACGSLMCFCELQFVFQVIAEAAATKSRSKVWDSWEFTPDACVFLLFFFFIKMNLHPRHGWVKSILHAVTTSFAPRCVLISPSAEALDLQSCGRDASSAAGGVNTHIDYNTNVYVCIIINVCVNTNVWHTLITRSVAASEIQGFSGWRDENATRCKWCGKLFAFNHPRQVHLEEKKPDAFIITKQHGHFHRKSA